MRSYSIFKLLNYTGNSIKIEPKTHKTPLRLFIVIILLVCNTGFSQSFTTCCLVDAGKDTTICLGKCVKIGGKVPGSDTCILSNAISYVWEPSTFLDNPSLSNPNACPNTSITYTLTVYLINTETNDTTCSAKSTVTVTVNSNCYLKPNSKENNPNDIPTPFKIGTSVYFYEDGKRLCYINKNIQ